MPDWSYHPLLRPASRLLPRSVVGPFTLKALALIARLPGGGAFIELLGDMRPPPIVSTRVDGLDVASPVGLGAGVDPGGIALEAFARFGFGVIEVGPDAVPTRHPPGVRVLLRLEADDDTISNLGVRLRRLHGRVDGACLAAPPHLVDRAVEACRSAGIDHIFVEPDPRIARGAMSTARQVLAALHHGAELVMVDSGFVEAGPGFPKRINEALAGERPEQPRRRAAWRQGWPWIALLGAGMTGAGAVVLGVGLTVVTLPYDESFLGVSHKAMAALNPRLISFMKHDRITLAGTMLSLGVLYAGLALGMRRGATWARRAMVASGAVGFASLFLFLGFHYVDPLHVVLAVVLFPLFLAGVLLPTHERWHPSTDLDNDGVWRASLWGQLFFIALGAGLMVAGVIIAAVGVTGVFVWSDLQFLGTSSAALSRANSHLLPLIAHDRAGFGGALASDGIGVMLFALWGFRRGERWVWWTLLLAGSAGFLGGVYAHLAVGYLEFGHLLPVAVAGAVFLVALVLSAPYLRARAPRFRSR